MSTLIDRLKSANAIRRFIGEELPFIDLGFRGVSQVSAGVRHEGCYWMTKVGHPAAPRSAADRLLLELARVRADAILITGAILRAEPALSYEPLHQAFAELREELGLKKPPRLFVLTRSLAIDPAHPIFRGAGEVILLSGGESAASFPSARVIKLNEPSLMGALDAIDSLGSRSISIEAGPNVASELYEEGSRLDELLFARFEPRAIEESALTEPLCEFGALQSLLPKLSESRRFEGEGTPTVLELHSRV